jgi:hypothetical protein
MRDVDFDDTNSIRSAFNWALVVTLFESISKHFGEHATDKWAYGIGKISTSHAHDAFCALMIGDGRALT